MHAYLYSSFYLLRCSSNKSCNSLCLNYCMIVQIYRAICNNILLRKCKRKTAHPYIENTLNYSKLPKDWLLITAQCSLHQLYECGSLFSNQPRTQHSRTHLDMSELRRCNQQKIILWDDTYSLQIYSLINNVEEKTPDLKLPKSYCTVPYLSAWLKGCCADFLTWTLPRGTAYCSPFISVDELGSPDVAKVLCPAQCSDLRCS